MSNVAKLGLVEKPAPSAKVIEILEELLDRARAGKIAALIGVTIGMDGSSDTFYTRHDVREVVAALAMAQFDALNATTAP